MTAFPIIMILLVMLPVLGGLAGIVLFVVGLVKKKPAMWGSGIGLAVLSALIFVVGAGAAFYLGLRGARVASRQVTAARAAPVAAIQQSSAVLPDSADSEVFRTCTGLQLPEGAIVLDAAAVSQAGRASRRWYYLRLRVSPAFRALLREHFQQADWEDVLETLTSEPTASVDLWTPADLRNKTYHTRTYRAGGGPDRMVTTIACDPGVGVAYFIGVRERDEQSR